jgi:hypothetical protein
MRRRILLMLAIALVATGCGHPLIPASIARSSTPPPAPLASATAIATPTIGSINVNAKPVLGVDLYANGNYPAATVQAYGERMLSYIKDTLKANAVGIVWNLYAPSRTSNVVRTGSKTLTPSNVAILTEIAKQAGLTVYYRPLIFVPSERDPWQGKITPSNPAKWFNSYYQVELPYLRVAQQFRVPEFVAETEMQNMNGDPGWTPFFQRIAKVYRGTVSYAAYETDYFPPHAHLQNLAALGMDMYESFPRLRPSASASAVLAGWEYYFNQVPKSVLERTTIQETGIAARATAYRNPELLGAQGRLDPKVQASWFTAACMTVKKYNLRGVFFFKVDLADNPVHPATSLSTFEGRAGARAIAGCASILG